MCHILYLSYDGLTDPLGQSQIIPYLTGLSQNGYHFTIISFEKNNRFEQYREIVHKTLALYGIHWHPLSYHKKPPVISTLYDIYQLKRIVKKLHKQHNFSIVHCRSYITALVGLDLKESLGLKFVFDMRGFWADERVEGGLWNLKNPLFRLIYQYFKRKEREFITQADYVISLTEAAKAEIMRWDLNSNNPVKIKVIPCCADLQLFNRDNIDANVVDKFRSKLNIQQDDFILLYLGAVGTWYMLEEMLDFFKRLYEKKENAKFLFVTTEHPRQIYNAIKHKAIPTDQVLVTSASREEVPSVISLADWAIFFIKPVYSKIASSPTKQGELMGMGIPIICNEGVGDTALIIRKTSAGEIISSFNSDTYDEVVNKLSTIYVEENKIRQGAQQYFSLKSGIDSYNDVYNRVNSF